MKKITVTGILLLILIILNIPTLIWLVYQLPTKSFKIIPETFTAIENSEVRFLIIGQSNADFDVKNLRIEGLPKDFTWNITNVGTRHENDSVNPITDNVPFYNLEIFVPKNISNGTYNFSVVGNSDMSGPVSANIVIVDNIKFIHPGVLLSSEMLDRLNMFSRDKEHVWLTSFRETKSSEFGSYHYKPSFLPSVDADTSQVEQLKNDTVAVYTQAILWYITSEDTFAKNVINIMKGWSESLVQDFMGSNRFELAAWTGILWSQAAEITFNKHYNFFVDNPLWNDTHIDQFKSMLRLRYVNFLQQGYSSGNISGEDTNYYAAAMINIGVFLDDPATFLAGINAWRRILQSYIHIKKDGVLPVPFVFGNNGFVNNNNRSSLEDKITNGLNISATSTDKQNISKETCQELGHALSSLTALAVGSETARIQDFDLNGESSLGTPNFKRLAHEVELITKLLTLCDGRYINGTSKADIIYNDLVNRRNIELPNTELYILTNHLSSAGFMPWETLTHFQNS